MPDSPIMISTAVTTTYFLLIPSTERPKNLELQHQQGRSIRKLPHTPPCLSRRQATRRSPSLQVGEGGARVDKPERTQSCFYSNRIHPLSWQRAFRKGGERRLHPEGWELLGLRGKALKPSRFGFKSHTQLFCDVGEAFKLP